MTTLKVKDLSQTVINTIVNTISKRGYRVSYQYTNKKLTSIYFFDPIVFNKVKAFINSK